MDTEKTQYEIEVALAKSVYFNFVKNIVAFNVYGKSSKLPLYHECDMLVLNNTGYLTEIEIKRSYSDFLADFKKTHHHQDRYNIIKNFYYCIPEKLLGKCYKYLSDNNVEYDGIVTYSEKLSIYLHTEGSMPINGEKIVINKRKHKANKLNLVQQLQVARFGAMRCVMLREKITKYEKIKI
jgi:hypothetical protein